VLSCTMRYNCNIKRKVLQSKILVSKMLRSGNTIRLTPSEKQAFSDIAVDHAGAPTSVAEHDARLRLAQNVWAEGTSPEEQLVAAFAHDLQLNPEEAYVPSVPQPLASALSELDQVRQDYSERYAVDAGLTALPAMLKTVESDADRYRLKLPAEAARMDQLARRIRAVMPDVA
jgi:hypothetical protein